MSLAPSTRRRKRCAVIGSGPNGLAAAIRMAQAGHAVTVYEAQAEIGGGCRSVRPFGPEYVVDHCSAIHPLGIGSPYFRTLPLERYGLEWIQPPAPLAHPLDGGRAAVLERGVAATAYTLGQDGNAYARLFAPLIPPDWNTLCATLLQPLRTARYPLGLARFGLPSLLPATALVDTHFRGDEARALIAGLAAHSFLPLDTPPSAAFAMALGILGHAVGWPMPRGGSQAVTDALAAHLRDLGGDIVAGHPVASLGDACVAGADTVIAGVDARNLLDIAGERLTPSYRAQLQQFRPGPGVFKVDYVIDGEIPWAAAGCRRAGTVHLGGTFEEIAASEAAVARGEASDNPYVLLAQQSVFDRARAPAGQNVVWAYCHVPQDWRGDQTAAITAQIERFAPGFAARVRRQVVTTPQALQAANACYIGGDISGGAYYLPQFLTRPAARVNPWTTGTPGLYICSASTPPGGGVHGMGGYYAAQTALGELWRVGG